ncbi:surface antigen BspA-like [Trichomonas vaginalis G3]|uniref:Surface antigen BspA-like n=1 Tax=Trichomonas vaginalis (strain ATCC PRA-98 / G3) TaxID=412133 RepID=A2DT44_TRIV3|nr:regulation of response to stimulus [Trichomonas vaginalis G3]EAY16451.1 surface antigen BspA-like [Trichomonas vaginalis G3]KAI5505684.1 regulation of response to stimulus [Trichomonas vaginalis G3]|eukprot:XP_001328674.1 surface antigen BspA-like [Trichomonas vaginalis G3]
MTSLEKITLPSTLINISSKLFYHCSSLREIKLPDNITTIGEMAFEECSSLVRIEIPNSVSNICSRAFCHCNKLKELTLETSIVSIPEQCFYNCYSLETINIKSNKCLLIANKSFCNCYSLKSISFPVSLQKIESYAFANCSNLTELTFQIALIQLSEGCFINCTSLKKINLPNSLKTIEKNSFSNCYELQEIFIESNCSIRGDIFENCNKIENIFINSQIESFHNTVKSITLNLSVIEYPSLSSFNHLENIIIISHENESLINEHFITSSNVNISIIGNIKQISDKSFSKSYINTFLYCGDRSVDGQFLSKDRVKIVSVSEHYPHNNIGGVHAHKTSECPNFPKKPYVRLTTLQIILITISIVILISICITILIKIQRCRKSQKKYEDQIMLEKLVNAEFG